MEGLWIALVCPYSLGTPGGVQSHVLGLARYLRGQGARVDVLAPCAGADPPEGVIPLGGAIGFPDNGSVTRIALGPRAFWRTGRTVRRTYDVVHVHEPMLPAAGATAVIAARARPLSAHSTWWGARGGTGSSRRSRACSAHASRRASP